MSALVIVTELLYCAVSGQKARVADARETTFEIMFDSCFRYAQSNFFFYIIKIDFFLHRYRLEYSFVFD